MSSARRGAAAVTVDQIVCSASNFALMLLAIRALEVHEVGAFTLVFTVLVLLVVAVRALLCEPLLIGYAAAGDSARRAATGAAAGAALLVGAALALVAACAGALASGTAASLLLGAAFVVPALLLQDVCRFGFLAADRPWRATANDAACLVVTVGAALLWLDDASGPAVPLLCWGVGAAAAAVIGLATARVAPLPRGSVRYLAEQRTVGLPLAGAVVVGQGAGRLSLAAIALTSGVVALGLFGTALTILSPVNTLLTAAGSFALAEAARRRAAGTAELLRFLRALSAGLAGVVAIATALAFLLFGSVVVGVFGEVPTGVRALLWPAGAWALGTAVSIGALTGLRVLTGAQGILRGTAVLGLLQVLAALGGGALAGTTGACWGAATLALVGAAHWWRACLAAAAPSRPAGTTSTLPEQPRRDEAHTITTRGMA